MNSFAPQDATTSQPSIQENNLSSIGASVTKRLKRLPGRDIPISDDEDEEDDVENKSLEPVVIKIIEDRALPQLRPRRSSLVTTLGLDFSGLLNKDKTVQGMVEDKKFEVSERRRSVGFTSEHIIIVEDHHNHTLQEDHEADNDNEHDKVLDEMDRLMITSRSRERRKSIEMIIRPPTPPNVSHNICKTSRDSSREASVERPSDDRKGGQEEAIGGQRIQLVL